VSRLHHIPRVRLCICTRTCGVVVDGLELRFFWGENPNNAHTTHYPVSMGSHVRARPRRLACARPSRYPRVGPLEERTSVCTPLRSLGDPDRNRTSRPVRASTPKFPCDRMGWDDGRCRHSRPTRQITRLPKRAKITLQCVPINNRRTTSSAHA
jgi:hypothetical protein